MDPPSPLGFGGAGTTGWDIGFTALWAVHILAVLLFVVGIIFLILWAVKTLNQKELKTWGVGLVIIGAIVCLLTIAAKGGPWHDVGYRGDSHMKVMRMQMMERMMDGDKTERMMDEEEGGEHMMGNMSMDDMTASLESKTGDEFDEAFIRAMIPHHQGAIDMAKMAQTTAKHGEIREMAVDILAAQQREIDRMNQWLRDWGYED